jgi:ABC-2 type transport system permease protein
MSVWRLEWLRLARTRRLVALAASYVLFGLVMPVLTRYQEAIFRNVGGDVKVIAPPPTPQQGIGAYVQNASQIGLIVAVFVAAGSLAFDARPEWSAFLRTRARSMRALVVPKASVNAAAAAASFALGLLAAWYETAVLIGGLPVGGMLAAIVYGAIYLVFAVAVVALFAGVTRSVIGAAASTLAVLLLLPLLTQIEALGPWVPSELVGAPVSLADGASVTTFARAAIVALVGAAAAVSLSVRLLAGRET